jgi:hypothetical protein
MFICKTVYDFSLYLVRRLDARLNSVNEKRKRFMHTKANTFMRRLKPLFCLGALALAQQAFAAVPKIWSAQNQFAG